MKYFVVGRKDTGFVFQVKVDEAVAILAKTSGAGAVGSFATAHNMFFVNHGQVETVAKHFRKAVIAVGTIVFVAFVNYPQKFLITTSEFDSHPEWD
jgi:hypothetical protein